MLLSQGTGFCFGARTTYPPVDHTWKRQITLRVIITAGAKRRHETTVLSINFIRIYLGRYASCCLPSASGSASAASLQHIVTMRDHSQCHVEEIFSDPPPLQDLEYPAWTCSSRLEMQRRMRCLNRTNPLSKVSLCLAASASSRLRLGQPHCKRAFCWASLILLACASYGY